MSMRAEVTRTRASSAAVTSSARTGVRSLALRSTSNHTASIAAIDAITGSSRSNRSDTRVTEVVRAAVRALSTPSNCTRLAETIA